LLRKGCGTRLFERAAVHADQTHYQELGSGPDSDNRTWLHNPLRLFLRMASQLYNLATPSDSSRENDEPSRDNRNSALVVLKGICFSAVRAQPEVSHCVRVLGLLAFRVGEVKTEDSTLPILVRGRTSRVCTTRKHQDFPCGVPSNETAPQIITIHPPDNQIH
jgi:hypothetical protein